MRTEHTLEYPLLVRDSTEAANEHVQDVSYRYSHEIADLTEGYFDKCQATEGIHDQHLTKAAIMARYDQLTAGYPTAELSRDAFEDRISVWEGPASSLLKVRLEVLRDAALNQLDAYARSTEERIRMAPFDATRAGEHFASLAQTTVETLQAELERLKADVESRPDAYNDVRIEELEMALTVVAAGHQVQTYRDRMYENAVAESKTGEFETTRPAAEVIASEAQSHVAIGSRAVSATVRVG